MATDATRHSSWFSANARTVTRKSTGEPEVGPDLPATRRVSVDPRPASKHS